MQDESYGRSVSKGRGQRGTLETLPDGRTKARYRENGRAGKRPQRVFERREEAAAWLRDRLDELEAVRGGDRATVIRRREAGRTVNEALDDFLAAYDASPARIDVLRQQLSLARREFGERPLASLEPYELQAWRKTISPGYRADVFQGFRQVLKQAHAWHWIPSNPSDGIPNPKRKRPEVRPLPWENALTLSGEIERRYEAVPIVASGSGLRPEEWIALERPDVDFKQGVIHVRRVYSSGRLVELGADGSKTYRQRRRVPLRKVVADALKATTPRIDTPLWFPSRRRNKVGGWHLNLIAFREQIWRPSFRAADLPYQRPYDMRHTYAAESIAAGIGLFELSRWMGTSLVEIDNTYGHLVGDSEERGRALLDAYDEARRATKADEG